MLDEAILRERIQELQYYRRMGLTTAGDIDKFEMDCILRVRIRSFSMWSHLLHLAVFTDTTKNEHVAGLLCL